MRWEKKILINVLEIISVVISILSVEKNLWFWTAVIFFLSLMVIDVYIYYKENIDKAIKCKNNNEIIKALKIIIKTGGRLKILTRDMSWVKDDDEIFDVLKEKAQRHELTILMSRETAESKRLERLGAEVYYYGCEFVPTVRFTITRYRNINSVMYIAAPNHEPSIDSHIIMKYSSNSIIYKVADDLTESLIRFTNLKATSS